MPRRSLAPTSPNVLKRRPLSAAGPSLSTETATACITRRHPLTVRDGPTGTLHAPKTQWVAPPGHPGVWLVNTYPPNRKARRDAPPRPPSTQRCHQLHPQTPGNTETVTFFPRQSHRRPTPRDTVVLSKHRGATRAVYQHGHGAPVGVGTPTSAVSVPPQEHNCGPRAHPRPSRSSQLPFPGQAPHPLVGNRDGRGERAELTHSCRDLWPGPPCFNSCPSLQVWPGSHPPSLIPTQILEDEVGCQNMHAGFMTSAKHGALWTPADPTRPERAGVGAPS